MLDNFEKRHPSIKYNIIQFFLRTVYQMKKVKDDADIGACSSCGEPCANKVCKRCEILGALRGNNQKK